MKKTISILILLVIFGCASFASAQQRNVRLPAGVQSLLNQDFPGWRVIKNICQTAVSGDYNGDRKTDYVVAINHQNGATLVSYMSSGNGFRLIEVNQLDGGMRQIAIGTVKSGEEVSEYWEEDAPVIRLANDGLSAGECESDGSGYLIFKNDQWVSPFRASNKNSGKNNKNQIPNTRRDTRSGSSNNSDDGSVDIGKVILDTIRENRGKNRKPKDNSGGSDDSSYGNSSNGCVFKETFTIPVGKNSYRKEYPIALGNGSYRVEFAQNLPRDRMHAGFRIGFFNNRTDPTGEHWTKYIEGGSHSNNVRDKDPSIAYWTWATREQPEKKYRAGEFATSDNFTNQNYTTLRILYSQGVNVELAGATGTYEVRIIGPGCKSGSSSSTGNNNPPSDNPPPTSQGSRMVKLFFYKPKRGETRCYTNLVAVNRQMSGSQSILRASLNALFAENGSEEMENYTAGLSLVSVSVTNGVANIVVTGSQNNPCASLFAEQVKKTAMQFPTVKSVNIQFR